MIELCAEHQNQFGIRPNATMDSGLLEDWLRKVASPPSSSTLKFAPPSVHQIAHAWGQLRTCAQTGNLKPQHLVALILLKECGRALHVAEPQATLLLSILSSVSSVDAAALGQARGSAAMLLSIWIRKAFEFKGGSSSRRASVKNAPEILNAIVDSSLKALNSCGGKDAFVSEVILLLGCLCGAAQLQEDSRRICQEVIARECLQQRRAIVQGRLHEALAGVGYAITSSHGPRLAALVRALLLLWSDGQDVGKKDHMSDCPCLEDGLVLLHLMEWCGSTFTSQPQLAGAAVVQVMVEELSQSKIDNKTSPVNCAIVLSAAGLLRSFHRPSSRVQHNTSTEPTWLRIMQSLESVIASMVDTTLQLQVKMVTESVDANSNENALHTEKWFHQTGLPTVPIENKHLLLCLALAFSRCTIFPPSPCILLCLTLALLEYAMPLSTVYGKYVMEIHGLHQELEGSRGNAVQSVQGNIFSSMQTQLSLHVEGILFHEAGAICRAVCEQYKSADKRWQLWVENLIWKYSHALYQSHRSLLAVIKRNADSPNEPLRKVLEALLLSVVMLYSFVTKEKSGADLHDKGRFAVQVLSSLSCIEFIRQHQVPEYGDLVQRCVAWVSTSEAACATLADMFPSYDDIICLPGSALASYSWMEDTVQDARVLFCLRVLPSCLNYFPASSFLTRVAPIVLLYIQHPAHNLAQASHSLFAAFLSCNGDNELPTHPSISQENSRDAVKEQLAVRYIDRTLEEFQSVSHFDFLVMGVGAIARHLPAGSAATLYCISCLTKKANELFKCESNKQSFSEHNKSFEGLNKKTGNALETAKKFQILLLHLILIVDIQVLPQLLQETARLILGLPDPHQTAALEEAFDILAGSDDLTRKHILVPWLQSLSYLCFHSDGKSSTRSMENSPAKNDASDEVSCSGGGINLNPSSALEEWSHTHKYLRTDEVGLIPWSSRSRL